jgi:hypothetical protein
MRPSLRATAITEEETELLEPEPYRYEKTSSFETCCGGEIVVLGSAESDPPWVVRQSLGYCLRCEHWSWSGGVELTRPWVSWEQCLRVLEELRTEVLFTIWQPSSDPFAGRAKPGI